jgi:glycine cleavage system H protein
MSSQALVGTEQHPCVWMCAGLISYRLCDRDYDCESCPLDAALHAPALRSHPRPHVSAAETATAVPRDRRYAEGHTWVQELTARDGARCRLGIDAFAAAIIGTATGLRCAEADRVLERGDRLCDLDIGLGLLSVGAPVNGRLVQLNPLLRGRPNEVVHEPYGAGWIAELADVRDLDLRRLATAEGACERTRADLTRFRRAVALRLFADLGAGELGWLGLGQRLTDLRQMLGPVGYLELVAGFVH